MRDVYKNIGNYNTYPENKILIVFDDIIADMIRNKNLDLIVTELFIRGRKLNISFAFITQSYFKVPEDVRLNTTHFFIAKISNRREFRDIAMNHSSDVSTKHFINIYNEILQWIIHQILALKISLISTENVLLNHIHF